MTNPERDVQAMRFGKVAIEVFAAVLVGASAVGVGFWLAGARPVFSAPKPAIEQLVGQTIDIGSTWTTTNPNARVVVVEFSDFQCPHCGRFARETQPTLRKRFVNSGQVDWLFKHFPLEEIHPAAVEASKASMCLGRERFWEAHDVIFATQSQWPRVGVGQVLSSALHFRLRSLSDCLAASVPSVVADDIAQARKLKLNVTPSFLLGDRTGSSFLVRDVIEGNAPVAVFEAALERLTRK